MNIPRCLLPLTLLLAACDGGNPSAPPNLPPDAAAEYLTMREAAVASIEELLEEGGSEHGEQELRELLELLRAYEKSGTATLRTPGTGFSLLHFAVQYRKEALVRELLRQGAAPNATLHWENNSTLKESDPVLAATLLPKDGALDAARAIRLIDMLVAAGAEVKGKPGGHALLVCSFFTKRSARPEAEKVYLHLLELGASPWEVYTGWDSKGMLISAMLNNSWCQALSTLMERGYLKPDTRNSEEKTLLFTLVEEQLRLLSGDNKHRHIPSEEYQLMDDKSPQESLAQMRVLLDHGADPNAPQGGGWTPLTYAAFKGAELAPLLKEQQASKDYHELLSLLLQHGGNADTPIPGQGKSVRDYLPQTSTP